MTAAKKVGLIAAGYMLAGLFAWVGVSIYIWVTPNPDHQASGGMSAFGDSLVFLAMFCVAAIPATAMGCYWLKPYRTFWLGCIPWRFLQQFSAVKTKRFVGCFHDSTGQ